MLHFAAEFAATLNLNLRIFELAGDLAGGTDVQMVTAMDHLVQLAFDFNTAGRDFAGDLAGLANKYFLSGQFAIDRAVDRGFFRHIQGSLECHAITDHEVVGLIHIGCHKNLSVGKFQKKRKKPLSVDTQPIVPSRNDT